ncbi:SycD/LcrH family type III secretion system chaperone [Achromobacter xylosoxidans]
MSASIPFSKSISQTPSGIPVDEAQIERMFDTVIEGLQEGATFKDMYGVSSETMEAIYAQAYDFYQQGRLDEAEALFRLLCIYDFYNVDYAIGFGAVFQLKKQYDKALDVYAMAYTISGGDQRAMLYAGECNLLLRRMGKARRCFQLVVDEATDERIKGKASMYLQAMGGAQASVDDEAMEVNDD